MPLRPPFYSARSLEAYCFSCRHHKDGGCAHPLDPKPAVDDLDYCPWHMFVNERPPMSLTRHPFAAYPHPTDTHYQLVYIGGQPTRVAAWQLRALSREHRA